MRNLATAILLSIAIYQMASAQDLQDKSISTQQQLKLSVSVLTKDIGERNLTNYDSLNKAAKWIDRQLKKTGFHVSCQTFQVHGLDCHNIIAEKKGTTQPKKIIVIGAHYDSAENTPGANDNGSGVASLLVLANRFRNVQSDLTIRFVAFTNEEPPYFQREDQMGSWVYARACRKNSDDIVGVISLETMGYFTDEKNSQNYPAPIRDQYPTTGNFIGFVGDTKSRPFTRRCYQVFKDNSKVPIEVASLPGSIPGVGWSDHWSFWQEGYAGLMVTDTAPFRYPHYHRKSDTVDKLDFAKLAAIVDGLEIVIKTMATAKKGPSQ